MNESSPKVKIIGVAAVFVLFSLFRLDSLRFIFSFPELRLLGPDSYYHLRRIIYTFQNFPDVLVFDKFLSYPDGDFVPWTPLFDFFLGFIGRIFGNPVTPSVFMPYIFSVFLFTLVYFFQRKQGATSLLVTLIILSCSLNLSNIQSAGYIDHHCLEVLLVCLFYFGLSYKLNLLKRSILLSLVVSLSFLNWPGAPLYYGPVFIFVIYKLLKKELVNDLLSLLSISFLTTSAILTFYLNFTKFNVFPYSFKYLSGFQRDFAFISGVFFLSLYLYSSRAMSKYIVFTIIFIALVLRNELLFEVFKGMAYLGKTQESRLMKMVYESNPLFFGPNQFIEDEIKRNIMSFTPMLFCIPLILYNFVKRRIFDINFFAFCFFFLLTCFQLRMGYFLMPFFAIVSGIWIKNLKKQLSLVILIILGIYSLVFYIFRYNLGPVAFDLAKNPLYETMHYLREKTPQQELFLKDQTPYGVLSNWSIGHYVITLGGRPAAAHNFIAIAKNNKEVSYIKAVFSKTEEDVVSIMDQLNTPYIVLSDLEEIILSGWHVLYEGENPYAVYGKNEIKLNDRVDELFLHRLKYGESAKYLRLVYEADYMGNLLYYYGVFERVKAAKITTDRAGKILVSLSTVNDDISLEYNPEKINDRYVFTIPYSSEQNDEVRVNSIVFKTEREERALKISEKDVILGKEIYLR